MFSNNLVQKTIALEKYSTENCCHRKDFLFNLNYRKIFIRKLLLLKFSVKIVVNDKYSIFILSKNILYEIYVIDKYSIENLC